ncbi:SagB/ThcOx family dehydrogenase [Leptolyngbya sp. PCC 6406]|uniref:SagB/ThcOx family dehydrogenase n=1 Tax=Leptolyngbya sp. PCC 6406 TaxID=1173264 RepID=UPI0002AC61C8|nr:SagB/ThcOx family dehydrogenase [Leptolyngbya sp. PCC 6406]
MAHSVLSFAQHFHDRTKYAPETLSRSQGAMQGAQPEPFKTYKLGTGYDLKPYLDLSLTVAQEDQRGWIRLSHLLINTYGLTARVMTMTGEPFYLRAAPSAGGLYPAEIYVISRGTTLLPAGLYNYQARTHSLWRYWEDHVWQELQTACFWHPALEHTQLAVVVTAVFYRSAWRYQDRAYRRICLDTGHLLGNLELAGNLSDYRPHLIGGFADGAVNQLLYLNEAEEGTIAIAALADLLQVEQNLSPVTTAQPAPTQTDFPAMVDGELLAYLHQSTCLEASADLRWTTRSPVGPRLETSPHTDKYNFPFCLKVSTVTDPILWDDQLRGLETTLLGRRSTREFSGGTLTLDELSTVLDFTYQPQHYVDQGCDSDPDYFDLGLIQTFVAVSGVEGLDAGCYYYAPHSQELRQIRFKNFRRELHYLCLGQDLGRDAAAVIFHTADLKQAVATYGDRVYRYLHLDAGHLGQRLNLAAIRLGLGVSGIGGFFDDQVNEVLGIPADEAALYITALGQPAEA